MCNWFTVLSTSAVNREAMLKKKKKILAFFNFTKCVIH